MSSVVSKTASLLSVAPTIPAPIFNWRQLLLAATVPAGVELVWMLISTYTPVWLQAGSAAFDAEAGVDARLAGFGLTALATGAILTMNNAIAFVVSPIVGVLSDATRSRWGRRKPWLAGAAPVVVAALVVLPLLAYGIPYHLSGQTAALAPRLMLFVAVFLLLGLALAVIRSPASVLLYDITPSRNRGLAAAVSGVAGALAGLAGAAAGVVLFGVHPALPFWLAGAFVGASVALVVLRVRETAVTAGDPGSLDAQDTTGLASRVTHGLRVLHSLSPNHRRSIALLLTSIVLAFVGFGQLSAFVSSYGLTVLHVSASQIGLLYATGGVAFMLAAFPATMIASRWLRRKSTQLLGSAIYVAGCLAAFATSNSALIWALVAVTGAAWALINLNQEPMVIDSAPSTQVLGTFNSLLQMAKMLGFALAPAIGGLVIQLLGSDYRSMWLVMAAAQTIAAALLLPVVTGEAKES